MLHSKHLRCEHKTLRSQSNVFIVSTSIVCMYMLNDSLLRKMTDFIRGRQVIPSLGELFQRSCWPKYIESWDYHCVKISTQSNEYVVMKSYRFACEYSYNFVTTCWKHHLIHCQTLSWLKLHWRYADDNIK